MKQLLTRVYAYKFFEDFVLIYPLYAVMFTDFGMAPWQVGTLLGVWSITAFLLEVPSGVWADQYSRKHLLCIGQCIRGLGYLCWFLFPGFWGFLIGFIAWGIESATSSGTFQALVYDELKLLGRETDFTRVIGRARTFSFVAILLASVLASPLILLGYPVILLLSSLSVIAAGRIILSLPPARKVESTEESGYFDILRAGLREVRQQSGLLRMLMFLALATALPGALDEYWSIFADQTGLPLYGLGLFLALLSAAEAVGSYFAYRFEQLSNRFFYLLFVVNGLLLLVAAWWFRPWALLLLIIFSFSFTSMQIVLEGRLQHAIQSGSRATVSSVGGFLTEIGALSVFIGFGWAGEGLGYQWSFALFGLIIILTGLAYMSLQPGFLSGNRLT